MRSFFPSAGGSRSGGHRACQRQDDHLASRGSQATPPPLAPPGSVPT